MTDNELAHDDGRAVRANCEAYDLDGTRVVMLSDPENAHAWIQSDVTVVNEP